MCNKLTDINELSQIVIDESLLDSISTTFKQSKETYNRDKQIYFSEESPTPFFPSSNNFEDFNDVEIARQLCLIEQNFYRNIQPKECLNQSWSKNKEKAPDIIKMIDFFNTLSSFIITKICSLESVKDRGNTIKKFLNVLIACREYNNFDVCAAICSGLNSTAVYRLQLSWKKTKKDKKLYAIFQEINDMVVRDSSFSKLRKTLKSLDPPCIPYLGMYLKDLTFIEDGNPNYLTNVEGNPENIINFEKMRKLASVIQDIFLYQQKPYNFQNVDLIHQFFTKMTIVSEEENFEKSRQVEPKEMIEEFKKTNSRRISMRVSNKKV